jgi:DNA repair protein radc
MHEGHRQRLTQRYLNGGLESFEEHEILELLLFGALPRVDTNPVAHRLIAQFGSLAGVLEAGPKDLEQVEGVGPKAAAYLSMFPGLLRAYEKSRLGKRPAIRSIRDACDYSKTLLFGQPFEQFYMVWLGTQGRVIHCERLSEGSVTESPVYVSKVAAAALRHHAVKGFIAHNHPGGVTKPSRADVEATQAVLRALSVLGIELIDHIIVSDGQTFSFQADSLMGMCSLPDHEAYAAEYSGVRQMGALLSNCTPP